MVKFDPSLTLRYIKASRIGLGSIWNGFDIGGGKNKIIIYDITEETKDWRITRFIFHYYIIDTNETGNTWHLTDDEIKKFIAIGRLDYLSLVSGV